MTAAFLTSQTRVKSFDSLLILTSILLFGLAGCGENNVIGDPVEDASGLFTGTGSVNSGTTLADVRGFVHDNRFIFFDASEAVLYDGQISFGFGSHLPATTSVYKDGTVTASNVAATATITSESSISMTLNGAGYAAGTLTLTFDPIYNRGATIAKLAADSFARWVGDAHTPTTTVSGNVRILSDSDEAIITFGGDTGAPSQCIYDGIKSIPDPNINIYLIDSLVVTDGAFCDHIGTGYTGFFAVVDGVSTDDTLLFAATNGTNSNFSIMTK